MQNEFSAVFEQDGDWYFGYCLEVSGANGQGKTPDACRDSLREAIKLILDDLRDSAANGLPQDAIHETINVA